MPLDRLARRPPSLGDLNERVLITEKAIAKADFADEQWLENIQAQWFAASIYSQQPIMTDAYANKEAVIIADTGIWIRANDSYLPQIGHNIYRPFRKNGLKIDYVYKVNKIGQEFIDKGLIYLVCRTDIIFDSRLKSFDKPTPSYVPFQ